MSGLWQMLDPECIELELKARRKDEALAELAEKLASAGKVESAAALLRALLDREKLTSTGVGEGVAIPHAMISGLAETQLAFGRKREGLPFDAVDRKPVQLLFLLAGPPGHASSHLQLLSRLARLLRQSDFRQDLLRVQTSQELLDLLRSREEEA